MLEITRNKKFTPLRKKKNSTFFVVLTIIGIITVGLIVTVLIVNKNRKNKNTAPINQFPEKNLNINLLKNENSNDQDNIIIENSETINKKDSLNEEPNKPIKSEESIGTRSLFKEESDKSFGLNSLFKEKSEKSFGTRSLFKEESEESIELNSLFKEKSIKKTESDESIKLKSLFHEESDESIELKSLFHEESNKTIQSEESFETKSLFKENSIELKSLFSEEVKEKSNNSENIETGKISSNDNQLFIIYESPFLKYLKSRFNLLKKKSNEIESSLIKNIKRDKYLFNLFNGIKMYCDSTLKSNQNITPEKINSEILNLFLLINKTFKLKKSITGEDKKDISNSSEFNLFKNNFLIEINEIKLSKYAFTIFDFIKIICFNPYNNSNIFILNDNAIEYDNNVLPIEVSTKKAPEINFEQIKAIESQDEYPEKSLKAFSIKNEINSKSSKIITINEDKEKNLNDLENIKKKYDLKLSSINISNKEYYFKIYKVYIKVLKNINSKYYEKLKNNIDIVSSEFTELVNNYDNEMQNKISFLFKRNNKMYKLIEESEKIENLITTYFELIENSENFYSNDIKISNLHYNKINILKDYLEQYKKHSVLYRMINSEQLNMDINGEKYFDFTIENNLQFVETISYIESILNKLFPKVLEGKKLVFDKNSISENIKHINDYFLSIKKDINDMLDAKLTKKNIDTNINNLKFSIEKNNDVLKVLKFLLQLLDFSESELKNKDLNNEKIMKGNLIDQIEEFDMTRSIYIRCLETTKKNFDTFKLLTENKKSIFLFYLKLELIITGTNRKEKISNKIDYALTE